ncbi:hypothetical protein B0H14DRAFT_2949438 [Mycena olivaceomarginata]|nr:hypothetical protein B0H14DRAFT_2949438 [Mycena olivaceomarginata]
MGIDYIEAPQCESTRSNREDYPLQGYQNNANSDLPDNHPPSFPSDRRLHFIVHDALAMDDGEEPADENAEEDPERTNGDDADATAALNAAPKPRKFRFDTPAGVADFVAWCLESDTKTGSSAFHWAVWGEGVKKGFFQSQILLYTLAYHLERLEEIPGGYARLESRPLSALLMSAQAVERELQFWRSGEYVQPGTKDSSAYFSIDNWDDTVEMVKTP